MHKQTRGKRYRERSLRGYGGGLTLSSTLLVVLVISTLVALYVGLHRSSVKNHAPPVNRNQNYATPDRVKNDIVSSSNNNNKSSNNGPSIRSFQDLTQSELHPIAGPQRHIVSPPSDDEQHPVSLVTCRTTVGYLHVLVHTSWAPRGAERFLQMVNTNYFSSKVALMRCIKNFLCQFGIAGISSYNSPYSGKNNLLEDDPNWLPEGPTHRTNELKVKRFAKGYLAYAGSGKNSRSNQLIVALADNERLGGGSPWEVPWGELVGEESFTTLGKIYTGYGDNGPSQGRLHKEGSSKDIEKDFPKLDYILECNVIGSR